MATGVAVFRLCVLIILNFNNGGTAEACSDGYFGPGCNFQCSGNCKNNATCNSTTGVCDTGCRQNFTGPFCTQENNATFSKFTYVPQAASVTIVAVGLSLVAVAIVVPLTLYYRSKYIGRHGPMTMKKPFTRLAILTKRGSIFMPSDTKITVRKSQQMQGVDPGLCVVPEMVISDLTDRLRYDRVTGYVELAQEFQSIPIGEQSHIVCNVAKLHRNLSKNRSEMTLPYDHSRVILRRKENKSDYINASYISSEDGTRYIASQGPLECTVDDHWLMIWQEQVSVVVMLSNITDDNKEKCCQYWPIKGKVQVEGSLSVRLLQEKKYAFYTQRKLKLDQKATATSRLVCLFQFTMWSDSEIPYPSELVQFYRTVKRLQDAAPNSPLLVHCSEGGGRTGTFIALDKLHRTGLRDGRVNVTRCLLEMCDQRMNMVENMEQYILLYHTLKESFYRNVCSIRKEKISKMLTEEMQKPDKENSVRKQFCELMCVRPVYDDIINETGHRNMQLNLLPSVLPDEEFRLVFPSGERRTRNDFYNTVFFSTITEYNGLIAAPYPGDNTAEDLIRLILRQNSSVVVTIHPLIELHSTMFWYPEHSSELSQYKIFREANGYVTNDVQKATIRIENTKRVEVHRVHVYEILSWSTKNIIPRDTKLITTVIKEARQSRDEEGGGPITVMSYDGACGCGLFIAIYNALEQLGTDGTVDLFSIVHDIHIRLPRMMSTMDEYEFCYQAIAEL